MSGIFGSIGVQDNDRSFVNVIGQKIVWDAVQAFMDQHNRDLEAAYGVFVEGVTDAFKERYKLPGGGYLQPRSTLGASGAVKATGQWDVAYPLNDFGAALAWNDVDFAYLSIAELSRHLLTVQQQDINTMRREILKALLDNATVSFVDDINGTLTVQALANGDSVTYPPVLGSDSEATESHMYGTNYLASAMSDTNNPFVTAVDELEEHFGAPTGGSNIVTFINNAQKAKTEALSDFDEVTDRFVKPGANTDEVTGLPASLPGRTLGRVSGTWIQEWRYMPSAYSLTIHLDAPKPLKMRVDPADTGLAQGLQLIAKDETHPFETSFYRHRYGVAVGNRLNGVALHITNSASYTVPTGYDR